MNTPEPGTQGLEQSLKASWPLRPHPPPSGPAPKEPWGWLRRKTAGRSEPHFPGEGENVLTVRNIPELLLKAHEMVCRSHEV